MDRTTADDRSHRHSDRAPPGSWFGRHVDRTRRSPVLGQFVLLAALVSLLGTLAYPTVAAAVAASALALVVAAQVASDFRRALRCRLRPGRFC